MKPDQFAFIIGSPRSGTTVLGDILNKHNEISQWYEPYFILDHHFRLTADDVRTENDVTPEIKQYIYSSFLRYGRHKKARIIIDKSPRNSLKVPFITKIFPQARFIHIIRDGRDATLSIHKKWKQRINIFSDPKKHHHFNYKDAFSALTSLLLNKQPMIRDKIHALWFETHGQFFNKKKHLNRLRWSGAIGWGPRFKGWEEVYNTKSLLQLNSYQWVHCISSIKEGLDAIDDTRKIEFKYEDMIANPLKTLNDILIFLDCGKDDIFFNKIPELRKDNYNKWKTGFTIDEISQIKPILTPVLDQLDYTQKYPW